MDQKSRIIEEYWLQQLTPPLPQVRLPVCDAGLGDSKGKGDDRVVLAEPAVELLDRANRTADLGGFILCLSALVPVFGRYASTSELVVGTTGPIHGDGSQGLIFLRHKLLGRQTYRQWLSICKKTVLAAFKMGATPIEPLWVKLASSQPENLRQLCHVALVSDSAQMSLAELDRFDLTIGLDTSAKGMALVARYRTAIWDGRLIRWLLKNTSYVLTNLSANMDCRLNLVGVICPQEHQVLAALNQTQRPYPKHKNIPDLFSAQLEKTPDQIAVCAGQRMLTYSALNRRAERVAYSLLERGMAVGDGVAVMLDPCLEMAVALLAILKVGGFYLAIRGEDPAARKQFHFHDSQSKWLLTDLTTFATQSSDWSWLTPARILNLDQDLVGASSEPLPPHKLPSSALAYMIYTSGTTGEPKGVVIPHRGVLRLVKNTSFYPFNPTDRFGFSGTLAFDASTFEIWGSLLNGATLCFGEKAAWMVPNQYREFLQKNAITTLWLTSPLFAHFVREDPEIFAGLKVVLIGGDVVPAIHADTIRCRYPKLKLINGYGPTENTTFSTTHLIERAYPKRIPIGRPIANATAYVVDELGRLQPFGVPGELWLGGEGLSHGYWQKPSLTATRFVPFALENRVYRSGDLVRWLADGTLDFLGRVDDQVNIRGYRIEPGEIEVTLLRHEHIQAAAVLPITEPDGHPSLAAYLVAPDQQDKGQVLDYLKALLPPFMLPSYVIYLDRLPLNIHGKLDRKALPLPQGDQGGIGGEPAGDTERDLGLLWAAVLGRDQFGREDNFFTMGGHSVMALQLLSQIHQRFSVHIGLRQFFSEPTIAHLAQVIDRSQKVEVVALPKRKNQDHYALSVSQQRLASLYLCDPQNPAFNIAEKFSRKGPVCLVAFHQALCTMLARHETLRIGFFQREGGMVQKVLEGIKPNLSIVDLASLPAAVRQQKRDEFFAWEETCPLGLQEQPPVRWRLLTWADGFEVLVTIHHIIADGWSLQVLQEEFFAIYAAYRLEESVDLPQLRRQFLDYVAWQNQLLTNPKAIRPAQVFWRSLLENPPGLLKLPYDFEAEAKGVGCLSSAYRMVLSSSLTKDLRDLAEQNRTSLFLVLLAGFYLLLADQTGTSDIVTGIPSANRQDQALKNVMGFFVDSLLLRTQILAGEPVNEYLQRITNETLTTLDNAHYPIELACKMVNRTWPEMLSTFFNMTTFAHTNQVVLKDHGARHIAKAQNSKMPLVMYLAEYKNGVEITTFYYNQLFKPKTIQAILNRYLAILQALVDQRPFTLKENLHKECV